MFQLYVSSVLVKTAASQSKTQENEMHLPDEPDSSAYFRSKHILFSAAQHMLSVIPWA